MCIFKSGNRMCWRRLLAAPHFFYLKLPRTTLSSHFVLLSRTHTHVGTLHTRQGRPAAIFAGREALHLGETREYILPQPSRPSFFINSMQQFIQKIWQRCHATHATTRPPHSATNPTNPCINPLTACTHLLLDSL